MAVRKVLQAGHKVLETPASPVNDFKSQRLSGLVEDLRDTLLDAEKRKGVGRVIAAPQIGASERVIHIKEGAEEITMVNPRIISHSPDKMLVWDSCLSYDLGFFVMVERSKEIEVAYQDLAGNEMVRKLSGSMAEITQHGIDHLDGVLSVSRAKNPPKVMMFSEWVSKGRPCIVH